MSFKISIIKGEPNFDSLPVAKIIDYPLEKRDYKPYVQNRFCLNDKGFYLWMWAFETEPRSDSEIKASFNFFPSTDKKYFSVSIKAGGEFLFTVYDHDIIIPFEELDSFTTNLQGEDLQGIYWGRGIVITKETIEKIYGKYMPEVTIKGNIYKVCKDNHYGSFYPVDFQSENPYSSRFFSDFTMVNY